MTKNSKLIKRTVCFLAALALALIVPLTTFAATSYIASWKEYSAQNKPAYGDDWKFHDIKDAIYDVLESGKQSMKEGDYEAARQAGMDGYYGFYDLSFENATNMYISGSRVSQMELLFSNLRTIAKQKGPVDEYVSICDELEKNLEEDANKLDGADLDNGSQTGSTSSDSSGSSSSSNTPTSNSSSGNKSAATLVFLGSFSIILREGFEAIIVVAAIISYLQVKVRNEGANKKKLLYPVYFGSLLGVALSFVMAFILNAVKAANTANQEIIEGITCLIAVCVLFYVCNWMVHRSETEAWSAYIKSKTEAGSEKGSIFALAFTAFLSVFREGAEVVLFFQPYMTQQYQSVRGSVWAGMIVGFAALVVVWLLIHFFSVKLPMRLFFNATSILMAVMCVCFLGSGIKELIEGGVFNSYTAKWLSWIPMNNQVLDVLGIYPLLNTLIPQLILAIILIILFHIQFKKNRAMRAKSDAAKAEKEAKEKAEKEAAEQAKLRATIKDVVLEVLAERENSPAGANPENK